MIELGTGTLSCEQICAIARDREQVRLAPGVHARLTDGHQVMVALAGQRPIYGRSTGVGSLLGRQRTDAGLNLGTDLLLSHSTTAGPPLPAAEIRAMVAVRLEQITAGRSGLGPRTAEALVDSLNADRMPTVGRFHSLGTGDVAPLARLALTLPPEALDAGDALALMSSNALAIGRAALGVVDLEQVLQAATVTAAISFLARDGAAEALRAEAAGPFPGPQRVARTLRALGADTRPPARLQDQYGLRTAPQTLGIAVDTTDALRAVVTGMAGAGLENPMVLVGSPPSAVHHGAFHAVHLTSALDAATLGLLRAAVGSTNRLSVLTTPMPPAAPPDGAEDGAGQRLFLAGGPPTASGIMVLEYTAAAALGVVRAAAGPASLQTADLSHGVEQDATFAPLAVDQLTDAIAAARVVVAVELVAATRALRSRGFAVPAELAPVWAICGRLPAGTQDRDLTADVELAERLLAEIAPYGERAAGGPVRPIVMPVSQPNPAGDASMSGDRPGGG